SDTAVLTRTLHISILASSTFTPTQGLTNPSLHDALPISDGTNTSVDTVVIAINRDNDAPTAHAGPDQTVNENDVVTLTSAGSSDPEGQTLTYTWNHTTGPAVTLSSSSAASPTFTAPEGLT